MALKTSYSKKVKYQANEDIKGIPSTLEQEHTIESAYVKIGSMQGLKNIDFTLEIYEDETKQNLICVDKKPEYKFNIDLSKFTNNIAQGYEYLKTLTEFKDAVDC